ncbi:MAG: CvpA family protein [Chthoniobacterales bacterium]
MNPQLEQAAGSPMWQLVFVSFALLLVFYEILRGWRRGGARQLTRLGALVAAYFAAFFGGKLLLPLARPFLKMPDVVATIVAGALLAIAVYALISGLGALLFKRTNQHATAIVRLVFGLSGAFLGLFFGAFLVWALVVGVRSIGAIADAHVREQAARSPIVHAVDVRRGFAGETNAGSSELMTSLARLRNSLEMGVIGDAVKRSDVVPSKTYDTLAKVGRIACNPQAAERFLSYPGARELSENPKIAALRSDPEIAEKIQQGRIVDLMRDRRIIDAANDPALVAAIKNFDSSAALDYATTTNGHE